MYENCKNALLTYSPLTLKKLRGALSLSFAKKCFNNERTRDMFPLNPATYNTRNLEKYVVTKSKGGRLAKSAIPHMQRLLNINSK